MWRLLLTLGAVIVAGVACSGSGDRETPILFVGAGIDEYREIFALNPKDGTITNLTNHSAHDFAPAWSPDGSKIAFLSTRDEEIVSDLRSADIYVMNADGSNLRLVASIEPGPLDDGPRLVWNPDGERLLYGQYQYQPVIAGLDGTKYEPPIGNAVSPVWSAGGDQIIFLGSDEESTGLYYWSADPSTLERTRLFAVTSGDPQEHCESFNPGWNSGWTFLYGPALFSAGDIRLSNTTRQALYQRQVCTDDFDYHQIATRDSSFENEQLLTDGAGSKSGSRWSPDGAKIAYMNQTNEPPSVWTMNADGSGKTVIAEDAGQPAWSPDSKKIAFVGTTNPGSYRRDEFAIFVANADGSDARVLADDVGWIYELEWSPVQ